MSIPTYKEALAKLIEWRYPNACKHEYMNHGSMRLLSDSSVFHYWIVCKYCQKSLVDTANER